MLADDVAWVLPDLRAEAEAWMPSTCTIRARDGDWTTDPDTGEATQAPGSTVYSGRCRVRPAGREAQPQQVGGAEAFVFDYLVSIPFGAEGSANVREGMPCTIDSSPDPALAGVELEIQKVDRGEHISARRLACNEVA
jgi:hypothetical protein